MPVKADQGSNLNQPQETGRKDTQRTVDAWPEMDPNRPPDARTTGRSSRGGASAPNDGSARREHPFKPPNELERGQHRSPGEPTPPPSED
ncbi:MAG TPA: hypothetical protein VHM01_21320 [Alphaproteobacteria bacterium]|nr:hypothetical protein [Alphaproteobacteria bacterium]